jgi:hypothetical protein
MKNSIQTFNSPIRRIFIYLSIFTVGTALHELLFRFIQPTSWSNSAVLLTLVTLGAFAMIGAIFACEQHAMSRVTSAATLLALAFIGLSIGHHAVPDPYLLLIALGIAALGAQSVLHRKITDERQIVLYSLLAIFIVVVIIMVFNYGIAIVDTSAIQKQYGP